MKVKKTGWVCITLLADTVEGAGEVAADSGVKGDFVQVTWEQEVAELDMAQALAIVARGGRVQWVTDSDGDDISAAKQMCPDEDGWIEMRPGYRYIEVKPATTSMTPEQAATRLGFVGGDPF